MGMHRRSVHSATLPFLCLFFFTHVANFLPCSAGGAELNQNPPHSAADIDNDGGGSNSELKHNPIAMVLAEMREIRSEMKTLSTRLAGVEEAVASVTLLIQDNARQSSGSCRLGNPHVLDNQQTQAPTDGMPPRKSIDPATAPATQRRSSSSADAVSVSIPIQYDSSADAATQDKAAAPQYATADSASPLSPSLLQFDTSISIRAASTAGGEDGQQDGDNDEHDSHVTIVQSAEGWATVVAEAAVRTPHEVTAMSTLTQQGGVRPYLFVGDASGNVWGLGGGVDEAVHIDNQAGGLGGGGGVVGISGAIVGDREVVLAVARRAGGVGIFTLKPGGNDGRGGRVAAVVRATVNVSEVGMASRYYGEEGQLGEEQGGRRASVVGVVVAIRPSRLVVVESDGAIKTFTLSGQIDIQTRLPHDYRPLGIVRKGMVVVVATSRGPVLVDHTRKGPAVIVCADQGAGEGTHIAGFTAALAFDSGRINRLWAFAEGGTVHGYDISMENRKGLRGGGGWGAEMAGTNSAGLTRSYTCVTESAQPRQLPSAVGDVHAAGHSRGTFLLVDETRLHLVSDVSKDGGGNDGGSGGMEEFEVVSHVEHGVVAAAGDSRLHGAFAYPLQVVGGLERAGGRDRGSEEGNEKETGEAGGYWLSLKIDLPEIDEGWGVDKILMHPVTMAVVAILAVYQIFHLRSVRDKRRAERLRRHDRRGRSSNAGAGGLGGAKWGGRGAAEAQEEASDLMRQLQAISKSLPDVDSRAHGGGDPGGISDPRHPALIRRARGVGRGRRRPRDD